MGGNINGNTARNIQFVATQSCPQHSHRSITMSPACALLIFTAFAVPSLCEYEWAGIFETPDRWYMWTAQKVEGEYADPRMKLVAIAADASSEEALKNLDTVGKQALKGTCLPLHAWGSIVPAAGA